MTVIECPRRLSWSAAASPAGPEPTTQTFLPEYWGGCRGTMRPSAQASSMTLSSPAFMVTGPSYFPQLQAFSQGAGQTLPVNSGKLLVFSSRASAWALLPIMIMSFHSGMRLCSGQPKALPFISSPA
jgi:hypothetical protein